MVRACVAGSDETEADAQDVWDRAQLLGRYVRRRPNLVAWREGFQGRAARPCCGVAYKSYSSGRHSSGIPHRTGSVQYV